MCFKYKTADVDIQVISSTVCAVWPQQPIMFVFIQIKDLQVFALLHFADTGHKQHHAKRPFIVGIEEFLHFKDSK